MKRSIVLSVLFAMACGMFAAVAARPNVGGPCGYTAYLGKAVITRVARPDTMTNAYSLYFRFVMPGTVLEQWADSSVRQEKDISAIEGVAGDIGPYRIKPGNTYACTLYVIDSGACTPLIYCLRPPSPGDNFDTSSTWTEPDSVAEDSPFALNLLSYAFNCNTLFSGKTLTQNAGSLQLVYRAGDDSLALPCAMAPVVYGTSFAAPALTQGKYPVFAAQEPACYPLCLIALQPRLVDTLTVVKALSACGPGLSATGGSAETRIYSCKGQTVFEGYSAMPGIATGSCYTLGGKFLGSFVTGALPAGWHRISVPDAVVTGTAIAMGPVIIRLTTPDGKECRKLIVRM